MTGIAMTAVRATREAFNVVSVAEAAEEKLPYFKPVMTRREAEELFELDAAYGRTNSAWQAFFVESLTEFLVFGERPTGHIRPEDVKWLASCLRAEMSPSIPALLRALVLQAEEVPASLVALAMKYGAMRTATSSIV